MLGRQSAAAIVARRVNDGWSMSILEWTSSMYRVPTAGVWRQDPWPAADRHGRDVGPGEAVRAVVRKAFRAPSPPRMTSAAYTKAYTEVKALGGATSSARTADQTETGILLGV